MSVYRIPRLGWLLFTVAHQKAGYYWVVHRHVCGQTLATYNVFTYITHSRWIHGCNFGLRNPLCSLYVIFCSLYVFFLLSHTDTHLFCRSVASVLLVRAFYPSLMTGIHYLLHRAIMNHSAHPLRLSGTHDDVDQDLV